MILFINFKQTELHNLKEQTILKKKLIWITLASILGIFAMILFVVIFTGRISVGFDKDGKFQVVINSGKGDLSTLDQIVLAMNNTHKTDIFVLGTDCHFRKDVAVKNIDSITETSVAPGADSEFHLIVINDIRIMNAKQSCFT